MPENNNIKDFTASDIEKYWKGKLSPAEMHTMEKAALDDPFLADALEGYQHTTAPTEDLRQLQQRLDEKTSSETRVISLQPKKYPWLKIAAAIIIISGIGLTLQQLVLKNKDQAPIAKTEKEEANKSEAVATNKPVNPDTAENVVVTPDSVVLQKNLEVPITAGSGAFKNKSINDTLRIYNGVVGDVKREDKEKENEITNSLSTAPTAQEKKEAAANKIPLGRSQADTSKSLKEIDARAFSKQADASGFLNYKDSNILSNKYNYRVVDAQNNPVPFANVLNTRDNIGTYTDIKGNFNLISSDSVMDVQIRSLGYNSANYKLVPSTRPNELVLKEDEEARRQITAPNRKMVSSVTRKDSTELEEPEVGWGNYNTYVANNIQIPDNIRAKNTRSDVELSFDIDKTGHPTNIKVTRSSQCKACDDEAIRLLKEGPKWKRKGKKSKTSISIAVDQK